MPEGASMTKDKIIEIDELSLEVSRAQFQHFDQRRKEIRESELASIKAAELASLQADLLQEANNMTKHAQAAAEESKKDAIKASKRALLSNIIAISSLVVALVSLGLSFYQNSGT